MAVTLRLPPQGHCQTSTAQVFAWSCAQSSLGLFGFTARAPVAAGGCVGEAGVGSTVARAAAWDESTPWKEVRWNLAGGMSQSRRRTNCSALNTSVTPFFVSYAYFPSSRRESRDSAMGPRAPYLRGPRQLVEDAAAPDALGHQQMQVRLQRAVTVRPDWVVVEPISFTTVS